MDWSLFITVASGVFIGVVASFVAIVVILSGWEWWTATRAERRSRAASSRRAGSGPLNESGAGPFVRPESALPPRLGETEGWDQTVDLRTPDLWIPRAGQPRINEDTIEDLPPLDFAQEPCSPTASEDANRSAAATRYDRVLQKS